MTAMDAEPVQRSERKRRGQGPSRRAEILDAAKHLFLSDGYEHATIRKIAAAVGVSSGALYLYFPDKDSILQAIAESTFETLLARLEESQQRGASDLERFRAGLHAYIAFGLAHPDEYRLTFQTRKSKHLIVACDSPDTADLSFAVLEAGVNDLVAAGIFRPGNTDVIAESIWCAMHGVTSVLMDLAERVQGTKEQLVDSVITMVVKGFSCRESDPA